MSVQLVATSILSTFRARAFKFAQESKQRIQGTVRILILTVCTDTKLEHKKKEANETILFVINIKIKTHVSRTKEYIQTRA